MTDRLNAASLFRQRVGGEKLIEGWIEGPCAEAADLRGINALMLDFYDDEAFVRDLFAFTLDMGLRFARAQLAAGADLIGIGDAAASLVGPEIYASFVWPYEKKLVEGIHAAGGRTRLHICGNTSDLLSDIGRLGCDIVDLDFPVSMSAARAAMGPNQVLLGNINPVTVLLKGDPDGVRRELALCRAAAGPRYIVGAGCEIPRGTPEANVRALCTFKG